MTFSSLSHNPFQLPEEIPMQLPVLYQDDYLIAVYKPAGLLVHRSWLDTQATQFALQIVRDQVGRYVYPLHRLDRPTAGILLMAFSKDIAAKFMPMFASGEVHKDYEAIVRGIVGERSLLDYPLAEELDKIADKNASQLPQAKPAQTEYWPLGHAELPVATGRYATSRYSWLGISPKTGRKHQIRRHMHHLSHPILGDTTHGDGRHNRLFRERQWFGLWLLARRVQFVHPFTHKMLHIECAYPPHWLQLKTDLFHKYPFYFNEG
ncbi:pseudouridine synthase [Celerinatantimonas sp. YJH-8]|uniref:pseudouridine synthase n=1 Tax=Celerinatantimonas sp. YJH-8 TaxID=3228714 RepID=UPI0038C38925